MSNQTPGGRFQPMDTWWGSLLIGLLLIGAAFFLNNTFLELETGVRESVRMNAIIVLLYELLGRVPTVLIVGAMGLFVPVRGVVQLIRQKR